MKGRSQQAKRWRVLEKWKDVKWRRKKSKKKEKERKRGKRQETRDKRRETSTRTGSDAAT